jgi:hypothetical protein
MGPGLAELQGGKQTGRTRSHYDRVHHTKYYIILLLFRLMLPKVNAPGGTFQLIFMEKVQDVKGLGGMLNGFRDLVGDDKKITFVGSPGFCTPFALFLGYPVREKELTFVPGLDKEKARRIVGTEYGLELGEAANADADVIVILGGMAMPKIGVSPEEMKDFLTRMRYKKLVGVCFMSIFEKAGWCSALPFDFVMNLIIDGDVSR